MLGLGNSLVNSIISTTPQPSYGAVQFAGENEYIDLGETHQAVFRGSWTISFWINLDDSTPGTHQCMVGHKEDAGNQWQAMLLSINKWYFYTYMSSAFLNNIMPNTGFSGDEATGWLHVVVKMTNNGGTNNSEKEMYINGNSIGKVNTDGTGTPITGDEQADYTTTESLFIGGYNNLGSITNAIAGKMTHFAIWDEVLDDPAITEIFGDDRERSLTGDFGNYDYSARLVRYFKFDVVNGDIVKDEVDDEYEEAVLVNGAEHVEFIS